ncbi:MAG: tyrosine-type recombinase/integrase [Anaerolineae bacterium]|nr:tyrosine-type recombinase/integrase [Anaerolineae bacterium]MCO5196931.1 tyrosine-type recombinase/integrase [Anaerolineae bacterium]
MSRGNARKLPISGRSLPDQPSWLYAESFLQEAGAQSLKTEQTYRSGLRLFADWLQHFEKDGYSAENEWPLNPDLLTTATALEFRTWLTANRSRATVTTYTAAVLGYLDYLDGLDILSADVDLNKLRRHIRRRKVDRNMAANVVDLEHARADVPRIVHYYDTLPLPPENDRYNHRLSLLRNRALVHTFYSTAARISEVVALNRTNIDQGRARYATIIGKGNRARTLYFRDYALESIRAYLKERTDSNRALFVAHSRNRLNARLSATSAHNIVKKAVRAEGLHESLSAHDFRHFRATQLLREGIPIEVVQEFLGHADIGTTRSIYAPVLGAHIVGEWLDNMDVTPVEALQRTEEAASAENSESSDDSPFFTER